MAAISGRVKVYQNRTLPVSKTNNFVYHRELLHCKSLMFYSGMRLGQFFTIVHSIQLTCKEYRVFQIIITNKKQL